MQRRSVCAEVKPSPRKNVPWTSRYTDWYVFHLLRWTDSRPNWRQLQLGTLGKSCAKVEATSASPGIAIEWRQWYSNVWVWGQWKMRDRSSWSCDATGRASNRSHVDLCSSMLQMICACGRSHAQLQCTQSMFACIDQHVDQSMFHFLLYYVWISVHLHVRRLHRWLLRIRPLASEKRLHQLKTCAARQWNLRQHPTLALLEHFEAPWRSQVLLFPGASFSTVMVKKGSVPIMANFEPFYLRSVNECGGDFWWKYSQDTALQEIPRRNSVLYFWTGPSLVEVAVRTTSWLVSAISYPRRVCQCVNADVGVVRDLRVGKSTTVVLN